MLLGHNYKTRFRKSIDTCIPRLRTTFAEHAPNYFFYKCMS